ncbi:MAG: hypothetical protein DWQ05_10925 [Calditrichaeota bacterium]|nr:MAG: hypothetical protein DWQ05_10925 [Calditrichota bacterium]
MRLLKTCILFFLLNQSHAQSPKEILIEGEFNVHPSNIARFNSPITTANGSIYIAFISPELETVVAQKRNAAWQTSIIAEITQDDAYHNAPSIATDERGYIHVLYNMHATPWQYSVSKEPENITSWEFRGQYAGENPGFPTADDSQCEGDCYDNWIGNGVAEIPGNQIGYMFMGNDRNGKLYVGFRECYYCDNSYHERQRSGGIVTYDSATKTWERVGNNRPWATDSVYSTQVLRFFFDRSNRMHISWVWGQHYTKDESSDAFWFNPNFPSYAYSDDGGQTFFTASGTPLSLPINFAESGHIIEPSWIKTPEDNGYFWGYSEITAMPDGTPYVLIFPRSESKPEVRKAFCSYTNAWSSPTALPWGGEDMVIDSKGVITVISAGIRMHRSADGGKMWHNYEIDLTGPYEIVVDYNYAMHFDSIRFMAMHKNSENPKIKIYTVTFTDGTFDTTAPTPPKNLKAFEK